MKLYKKIILIIITFSLLLFVMLCIFFVDNKTIVYETFNISNGATKDNTEIKAIHLSDMHFSDPNKFLTNLSTDTNKLLERIESENPDLIFITGDLVDNASVIEKSNVFSFIDSLVLISSVYYVTGNHEFYGESKILYDYIVSKGVIFLKNESETIKIRNVDITILGLIDDIDYDVKYYSDNLTAKNSYRILLAHRPEKWNNYTSSLHEFTPNLILSGHAHGGQFRLFGQGIYAPNQGFFPKYTNGLYKSSNNDFMIVSRGIGNSAFPFRFNNKPHVPIIKINL